MSALSAAPAGVQELLEALAANRELPGDGISVSCDRLAYLERAAGAQLPDLMLQSLSDGESRRWPPGAHLPAGARLGKPTLSPQGRYVAFPVTLDGNETGELRVLDLSTERLLDGALPEVRHPAVVWAGDERSLWCTRSASPHGVPDQVVRYRLAGGEGGGEAGAVEEVFRIQAGEGVVSQVSLSDDQRHLAIHVTVMPRGTDLYVVDTATHAVVSSLVGGRGQLRAHLAGGYVWATSNRAHPAGELLRLRLDDSRAPAWETVFRPDSASARLVAMAAGPRSLFVHYRDTRQGDLLAEVDLDNGRVSPLDSPDGVVADLVAVPDANLLAYSEFTADFADGGSYAVASSQPSGARRVLVHNRLPHTVRLRTDSYVSADGGARRLFVVEEQGRDPDRAGPVFVTAFPGLPTLATSPLYRWLIPVLCARGVRVVLPVIAGPLSPRTRSARRPIEDLELACRELVDRGWVGPEGMVADGWSEGGLYVAMAMSRSPELFAGVVLRNALLDLTVTDPGPVGKARSALYGQPDNPGELPWLESHSPIHRIRPGLAYPPVLAAVNSRDMRVSPDQSRRFVEALHDRAAPPAYGRHQLIESPGGHFGAVTKSDQIAEVAALSAFVLGCFSTPQGSRISDFHKPGKDRTHE
ncbi:prolyl oligopeptidase family serine peptidase [Streptacidiphilus anmyonensis]|uniref:prolyl oligopeptidase family serine peptidase n=1 Tax=Streptacidiphilus anmyonensis TaxID=405782 RepID=UPI0005AB4767|nr:prolyl oligopeptidase family serine peptidase [Streptacidiphilus anmyonensis]